MLKLCWCATQLNPEVLPAAAWGPTRSLDFAVDGKLAGDGADSTDFVLPPFFRGVSGFLVGFASPVEAAALYCSKMLNPPIEW